MIAGNRRVEATRVNTRSRPSPRTQAVNGEPSQTPMTGRFRATTRSRLKPSTHENRCSRRELPIGTDRKNPRPKAPSPINSINDATRRTPRSKAPSPINPISDANASNPPIQGPQSDQLDQGRNASNRPIPKNPDPASIGSEDRSPPKHNHQRIQSDHNRSRFRRLQADAPPSTTTSAEAPSERPPRSKPIQPFQQSPPDQPPTTDQPRSIPAKPDPQNHVPRAETPLKP